MTLTFSRRPSGCHGTPRTILENETVDEMIYNTKDQRNGLILELQARCGLRIGELLNIKASDVSERKLTLKKPKSGKEAEVAFMPEQIAKRMGDYVRGTNSSRRPCLSYLILYCTDVYQKAWEETKSYHLPS